MPLWRKKGPDSRFDCVPGHVFKRCDKDLAVRCWDAPHDFKLRMAMFLQFHEADSVTPLEPGRARIRFAYRNFEPESVTFKRSLRCEEGDLIGYRPDLTLTMLAGREDFVRGSAEVATASDGAIVHSRVTFVSPREFSKLDIEPMSVAYPVPGPVPASPCCRRK